MDQINTQLQGNLEELLLKEPYLITKISNALGSEINARDTLLEVLKFLHLVHHSKVRLTPSVVVDDAWHEFLLFTKLYAEYCNEKFGRFIHHHPGGSQKENQNNFIKTIQFYTLEFGKPDPLIWGHLSEKVYQDADCGNCSTN